MAAAGRESDGESDFGWDPALDDDVRQLLSSPSVIQGQLAKGRAKAPAATTAAPSLTPKPLRLRPADPLHDAREPGPASPALLRADDGVGNDDDSAAALAAFAASLDEDDKDEAVDEGLDEGGRVTYPDLSRALPSLEPPPLLSGSAGAEQTENTDQTGQPLSPLARFRSYPRKPLSVSDLTSGAWCELQHEYTLTRLPGGRRSRTPAMRSGTRVHARLEQEVHTTVHVDVASKEDVVGLKMWNMVQGLRTLRDTGLMRELEVWGTVDGGLVVSGIIDALSYHCPDAEFEAQLTGRGPGGARTTGIGSRAGSARAGKTTKAGKAGNAGKAGKASLTGQSSHAAEMQLHDGSTHRPKRTRRNASQDASLSSSSSPPPPPATPTKARITDFYSLSPPSTAGPVRRKVYITDVKTRGSAKLPSGVATRPSKIQLFLYHRFLSRMAARQLDFFAVFARYGLDPDRIFSDAFMAQMASLHDEVFDDAPEPAPVVDNDNADSSSSNNNNSNGPGLLRYQTLRSLLDLVHAELALTFPHGADSIGSIVAVEYRLRPRQKPPRRRADAVVVGTADREEGDKGNQKDDDENDEGSEDDEDDEDAGRCIGTNVVAVDDAMLDGYLSRYLEWWRGERPARGADIEEASLKCGHCEFAADCDWRHALDQQRLQRVREKLANAPRWTG